MQIPMLSSFIVELCENYARTVDNLVFFLVYPTTMVHIVLMGYIGALEYVNSYGFLQLRGDRCGSVCLCPFKALTFESKRYCDSPLMVLSWGLNVE